MDKSTLTRNAIAGTVAGIGLVVGGVALASAQDAPNPHSESNNPPRPTAISTTRASAVVFAEEASSTRQHSPKPSASMRPK
jgi:hypothetical protein